MMTTLTRSIAVLCLLAGSATLAAQASLTVKLATLVPNNSIWHEALRQLGSTWSKTTGGRVTLQIYAGGVRGTEPSYIRLMNFDDLQGALLLPPGLAEIDEAFNVLGMPFFFDSDAEAMAVLKTLTPTLSAKLEAKRFHLVSWGHAGWVQVFSKHPIRSLADIQKGKGRIYTTEGNDAMLQCYAKVDFDPVPKTFNDIPAALKSPTGGLNVVPAPPLGASTMFFQDAPYMLDVRVTPLVGALVMTDRAWRRMSDPDRTAVLAAAATLETRLAAEAPALDAKAIKDMTARGLTVTTLDAAERKRFRDAAAVLNTCMRGSVVPADVYDEALRARDEYRRTNK